MNLFTKDTINPTFGSFVVCFLNDGNLFTKDTVNPTCAYKEDFLWLLRMIYSSIYLIHKSLIFIYIFIFFDKGVTCPFYRLFFLIAASMECSLSLNTSSWLAILQENF